MPKLLRADLVSICGGLRQTRAAFVGNFSSQPFVRVSPDTCPDRFYSSPGNFRAQRSDPASCFHWPDGRPVSVRGQACAAFRLAPGPQFVPRQTNTSATTVVFYERLLALLARRGVKRDPDLTPLEFADTLGLQPALAITRAYNRVRFGGQQLSAAELREIESTLEQLEGATPSDQWPVTSRQ